MSNIVALYDVYNQSIGQVTVVVPPYVGDSIEYNGTMYRLIQFKRPVLTDPVSGDRIFRYVCIPQ